MTAQYDNGDWWWLSFADEEGFRGACLVQGMGQVDAISRAWVLKINPGGEVASVGPLTVDVIERVPEDWKNRLLTKADCDNLEKVMS